MAVLFLRINQQRTSAIIWAEGINMAEELARQVLEQLKSGEISEYRVEKEQFLAFQPVLHKHEEFKNFRGAAKHGGAIVYTYKPGWTA